MRSFILTVLAGALLVGCGQTDQDPAELATDYKNYVSFTLDSTEWTAGSDGSQSAIDEVISVEIGEDAAKRSFNLTAWKVEKGASSSIGLYVDSLVVGEKMLLGGNGGRASLTTKSKDAIKPGFMTTDAHHQGSVTIITMDTVNHRVTGTFECRVGYRTLTNGKFDARYTAPKPM
jgi:hypothetical protein